MNRRTKRLLHLIFAVNILLLMSVLMHEGVHVVQAGTDGRIAEPITLTLTPDASYPTLNLSGLGIFAGGLSVRGKCIMNCTEHKGEWGYREAQAYSVQIIFTLIGCAIFLNHYNYIKIKIKIKR